MNNGIVKRIYRKKTIDKLQKKINMLGKHNKFNFDAVKFLNIRVITTILLAIVLILFTKINYFMIPFIIIIYYNLFYYIFITQPLKARTIKLDREALTFFEILTLSLESGRNLENSLQMTCNNIDSEISDEFKKCLVETKFGKSLMESLNDLKKRIPSEDINNIILNITETSVFGNSIVNIMNTQVEYLRDKQVMEIKGQINKIPNKVSIISVIFIIPLILLIILGPILINFLG